MADDTRKDKARELNQKDLEKVDGGTDANVSEYGQSEAGDPSGNDMTDRTWKKMRD